MKTHITTFIILLCFTSIHAQTTDLNYYIEQAKINSPLINKSENANKITGLNLQQIKSILLKPEINIESAVLFAPIISHDNNTSRFEWISQEAANYTGYDLSYADGGQYEAYISLKQPLLKNSVYQNYAKQTEIIKKINENKIVLTKHEIEQLVSYQYILCLKSKKQSNISSELINELKYQLQIMKKLVDNAIYEQSDLMLLQIEFQNFKNEYINNKAAYKNNLYNLNLLCGINDTNFVDIKDTNFKLKLENVTNSQFLTSYKLDSLNLKTEQLIFEQKYKPQLNLVANTGIFAIYAPALNRFGFSTGLSLTWNIYDGHQREIQREKTDINLQTLTFEKQIFITHYNIQKNKFLNKINAVNQQINATKKQLAEYEKLLELYKLKLSQAQISIMDFKNLLKDIATKKQENLILNMEKQILINSYNYWNY